MRLDSLLEDSYSVSRDDIDKAVAFHTKFGGRLERILINMGVLSEDQLPAIYSTLLGLERAQNEDVENWQSGVLGQLEYAAQLCELNWFVAAHSQGSKLNIYVEDPLLIEANQIIQNVSNECKIYVLDAPQLKLLKSKYEENANNSLVLDDLSEFEEDRLKELAGEAPTVNLLNGLITRAIKLGASDMHLEPVGEKYRVRYRIDGVLQEGEVVASSMKLPVVSRIKILANMDIAEKRRPQDGKIAMKIANENLDIRVSSLPLNDGESVVMRFLRQESIKYDMEALGLAEDIAVSIKQDLMKTAGVILLTGPTGSGKTTSLYTFLDSINSDGVKIITLEDPVEYQLDGVNQVQVQSEIGFDFAAGLRSVVRQDPDVIMLGEIRDAETARVALQSALTGHLVFSTVHTNDAPSAYTRLLDLGVDEFLLNAALVSIVAQRLVRKLCPYCSVEAVLEDETIAKYQLKALSERYNCSLNAREAKGCEKCANTGYRGRVAIVEYLRCSEEIASLEKDSNFAVSARHLMRESGSRTLIEDGLLKVIHGVTSIDEVMRVAG